MPRRQSTDSAAPPAVPIIAPAAVYDLAAFRRLFGVSKSCAAREFRMGRLRVSRRGGKHFILGAWILDWIEAGEIHPRKRTVTHAESNGTH